MKKLVMSAFVVGASLMSCTKEEPKEPVTKVQPAAATKVVSAGQKTGAKKHPKKKVLPCSVESAAAKEEGRQQGLKEAAAAVKK